MTTDLLPLAKTVLAVLTRDGFRYSPADAPLTGFTLLQPGPARPAAGWLAVAPSRFAFRLAAPALAARLLPPWDKTLRAGHLHTEPWPAADPWLLAVAADPLDLQDAVADLAAWSSR